MEILQKFIKLIFNNAHKHLCQKLYYIITFLYAIFIWNIYIMMLKNSLKQLLWEQKYRIFMHVACDYYDF